MSTKRKPIKLSLPATKLSSELDALYSWSSTEQRSYYTVDFYHIDYVSSYTVRVTVFALN